MTDLFQSQSDTIAALSTPPGYSGIGVIRISGPHAINIIASLFKPTNEDDANFPDRKAVYGRLVDPSNGSTLDDGLVIAMKGPHSYTGEDVVELSVHGSPLILDAALKIILDCGARLASRGEFTRRAFLNGRLDLIQAEAVIDLIMASSPSAAQEARERLDKRLSPEISDIIDAVTDIIAEIEANIEFSEELDTTAPLPETALITVREKMGKLIEAAISGRYRREGIRAAIIGKPNVGKSTLFNTIIGEDRMIATPFPGTTRDAVSENIVIKGVSFLICDTAGLRDDPDPIEEEGIRRTRDWLSRSDLALIVVDVSAPMDYEDISAYESCKGVPKIVVLNKSDLPPAPIDLSLFSAPGVKIVEVSARTGAGIDSLKDALYEKGVKIMSSSEYSTECGLNQRGVLLVESASRKIDNALELFTTRRSPNPEIVSLELTAALRDLQEITGDRIDEMILDRIFEQFCIGK